MIKTYDKSWHIYVRENYNLASQKSWSGLSVVPEFHKFMSNRTFQSRIWDIGCGANIMKEYYTCHNIYGIDETWEADEFALLEDSDIKHCRVDDAFAINSIHFGTQDDIKRRVSFVMECLEPGGEFFFTLNKFMSEKKFAEMGSPFFWQDIGILQNIRFIDREECKLEFDEMKNRMTSLLPSSDYDIDHEINKIWYDAIVTDSLWGRIRVTLKKDEKQKYILA